MFLPAAIISVMLHCDKTPSDAGTWRACVMRDTLGKSVSFMASSFCSSLAFRSVDLLHDVLRSRQKHNMHFGFFTCFHNSPYTVSRLRSVADQSEHPYSVDITLLQPESGIRPLKRFINVGSKPRPAYPNVWEHLQFPVYQSV